MSESNDDIHIPLQSVFIPIDNTLLISTLNFQTDRLSSVDRDISIRKHVFLL